MKKTLTIVISTSIIVVGIFIFLTMNHAKHKQVSEKNSVQQSSTIETEHNQEENDSSKNTEQNQEQQISNSNFSEKSNTNSNISTNSNSNKTNSNNTSNISKPNTQTSNSSKGSNNSSSNNSSGTTNSQNSNISSNTSSNKTSNSNSQNISNSNTENKNEWNEFIKSSDTLKILGGHLDFYNESDAKAKQKELKSLGYIVNLKYTCLEEKCVYSVIAQTGNGICNAKNTEYDWRKLNKMGVIDFLHYLGNDCSGYTDPFSGTSY